MKKKLVAAAMPVFEQEKYTLHYSGDVKGTVTIERDKDGKITVIPKFVWWQWRWSEPIDHELCPLIPDELGLDNDTDSIIIDGNTTRWTGSTDCWVKTVVDGNTRTRTNSRGAWEKTVVDGNTKTMTNSDGWWYKTIVDKQGYDIFITVTRGRN